MRKLFFSMLLIVSLAIPADAAQFTAPTVPKSGWNLMPQETESFADALLQLLQRGIEALLPDLGTAIRTAAELLAAALVFSILPVISRQGGRTLSVAAAAGISAIVFRNTGSLIRLASETVQEICSYGKLLCPVMTAALAAQGSVTSSSALYMGTTFFTALLGTVITRYFVPMVYGFLILSAANCGLGEGHLKKFADSIKSLLSWLLKTLLTVFTTYMSITGVITGTTDTAALKAAKLTVSTAVPVVGSILSDASESVLVSMGLMKNAAGVYGILATLAIFAGPFLKVGLQYLTLKASAALCGIFASKDISSLVSDLSSAMGLLLGMLAATCTMVLISTVCFLKGAG